MPLVGIGVAVVCETGTEIGSAVVLRSEGPSSVDSIPSFRTQFVGMPGLLKYRSSWRPVGSGLQPAVSSMTASFSVYDRRQGRAHPRIARCRSEHGRTRTKRSMGWRETAPGRYGSASASPTAGSRDCRIPTGGLSPGPALADHLLACQTLPRTPPGV